MLQTLKNAYFHTPVTAYSTASNLTRTFLFTRALKCSTAQYNSAATATGAFRVYVLPKAAITVGVQLYTTEITGKLIYSPNWREPGRGWLVTSTLRGPAPRTTGSGSNDSTEEVGGGQ